MGALGHYLEESGIATTQISLVREHTAALRPPRALWVPFILGRPFGVPNDAPFQRRVLLAALRLLEAPAGPVLEDYAEEAPQGVDADGAGFACPVSFAGPAEHDDAAALQQEIAALLPWHDRARERRGRTTSALSGLTADAAARFITDFIARPDAVPSYRRDLPRGLALRLACEDLKSFYFEAASAQPGARVANEAQRWFWSETAAGRVFVKLHEACTTCADASVRQFAANNLLPRAVLHERGARA